MKCVFGISPADLDDARVPLGDTVEEQTVKALQNADMLLSRSGLGLSDVEAVRVSLVDLPRLYERMDLAFRSFFAEGSTPPRSCVGVAALLRGALVELDVFARAESR